MTTCCFRSLRFGRAPVRAVCLIVIECFAGMVNHWLYIRARSVRPADHMLYSIHSLSTTASCSCVCVYVRSRGIQEGNKIKMAALRPFSSSRPALPGGLIQESNFVCRLRRANIAALALSARCAAMPVRLKRYASNEAIKIP